MTEEFKEYKEVKKSKMTTWLFDHAEEIILVTGIVLAYKLGKVSGYTLCLSDIKRLATRR